MEVTYKTFCDRVDALCLSKIPKRAQESEEEYLNKVYEEARAIFYGMVEDLEETYPALRHSEELDAYEKWYDKFYEDTVLDLCTILSIYE